MGGRSETTKISHFNATNFFRSDRIVNEHYKTIPVGVVNLLIFTDSTNCCKKIGFTKKRWIIDKNVQNNISTE